MLDDREFQLRADETLTKLYRAISQASDSHEFEADYGGTLTVEFEDPPAKFDVSPNSPVKQIWVSAQSKSYKFDWDAARGEFVLPDTRESLSQVMESAISRQLGETVTFR